MHARSLSSEKKMTIACDQNIFYREIQRRNGSSYSEVLKGNSHSTNAPASILSVTHRTPTPTKDHTPDAMSRDMNALKVQFASLKEKLEVSDQIPREKEKN